jgi:hypothetical protein
MATKDKNAKKSMAKKPAQKTLKEKEGEELASRRSSTARPRSLPVQISVTRGGRRNVLWPARAPRPTRPQTAAAAGASDEQQPEGEGEVDCDVLPAPSANRMAALVHTFATTPE